MAGHILTLAEILSLALSMAALTFSFGAMWMFRSYLIKLADVQTKFENHLIDQHRIFEPEHWQDRLQS